MSVADMDNARRKRGRRETTPAPAGPSLRTFTTSWQLLLEAAGKSPRTVRFYTDSAHARCAFLGQAWPAAWPAQSQPDTSRSRNIEPRMRTGRGRGPR